METKLIILLISCCYFFPSHAQEYGSIKSVKEVDAGLGFKNKEVEFYGFENRNGTYGVVVKKYGQQYSNTAGKNVNVYQSGGIHVDNDPPAWARPKTQSKSRQTSIRNRKVRNAQIEQHNREVREHNRRIEEQRWLDEKRREAKRRERVYIQVIDQTEERFRKQVDFARQQQKNMKILKDAKIDHLSDKSGYIPSDGQTIKSKPRTKTSFAGLVSQYENAKKHKSSAIPTTRITETEKFRNKQIAYIETNEAKGNPLEKSLYYARKAVKTPTPSIKYRDKSLWALSGEFTSKNRNYNGISGFEKEIERKVLQQQKAKANVSGTQVPINMGQRSGMENLSSRQDIKGRTQNNSFAQGNRTTKLGGIPANHARQDLKGEKQQIQPNLEEKKLIEELIKKKEELERAIQQEKERQQKRPSAKRQY